MTKTYAKDSGKQLAKNAMRSSSGSADPGERAPPSIQSKLVLLALHFPRVRTVWSSFPYAAADIFNDLKANNPDPCRAIAIGAEEDPDVGAGVNTAAAELLQWIPGVTSKNVKYAMSKVGSVRELCELAREDGQGMLGVEPGNLCYNFMHRGERTSVRRSE